MSRGAARGRLFPQAYSTDRRYNRLSLKGIALFPLMWAMADDQGRLCGDPEEIKYGACPGIDHITKQDIPEILKEYHHHKLILLYKTQKGPAIQMLDWWDPLLGQKLQWAWPSAYPPPDGWHDHLRYKKDAKTVITLNWPPSGETPNSSQVSNPESSGEFSGEENHERFSDSPKINKETEKGKRRGRGRGISPECSGEFSGEKISAPSPTTSSKKITQTTELQRKLVSCFVTGWGTVKAADLKTVIPRAATAKDLAQLRDLANELSAAGGCPLDYIDQAFQEACSCGKQHISYVRAVLFDWLGIERGPPK